jgi:hypothetical protein
MTRVSRLGENWSTRKIWQAAAMRSRGKKFQRLEAQGNSQAPNRVGTLSLETFLEL